MVDDTSSSTRISYELVIRAVGHPHEALVVLCASNLYQIWGRENCSLQPAEHAGKRVAVCCATVVYANADSELELVTRKPSGAHEAGIQRCTDEVHSEQGCIVHK